jgi:hypothetical protein
MVMSLNQPPGANSRYVSRGRLGRSGVAAVAQAQCWATSSHPVIR